VGPRATASTGDGSVTDAVPADGHGTPGGLLPSDVPTARRGDRHGRDDAGGPVHRALAILELLGDADDAAALGVVEIARQLGRDKSQVSRALKLLADAGFVDRESGTLRYRVGTRLFAIGARAVGRRLRDEADALVEREAGRLGERIEVCVRSGGTCMTISTAAPDSELRAVGWVGRTVPLSCTAGGRALLFDLDTAAVARLIASQGLAQLGPAAPRSLDELIARIAEDRERGWSLARHEMDRGLVAVGAPVRDAAGAVVAAVSAGGPESRLDPILDDVSSAVVRAASDLSTSLGAAGRATARPRPPLPRTPSAPQGGAQ
jgi:DNA-binding IclR family transcriptional regulator